MTVSNRPCLMKTVIMFVEQAASELFCRPVMKFIPGKEPGALPVIGFPLIHGQK